MNAIEQNAVTLDQLNINFYNEKKARIFLILPMLKLWNERIKGRARFARLSEHLQNDIGISELSLHNQAAKPFWKD